MATRARGCQRWAMVRRVRARRRSPPMASKPVAPTHQVPLMAPAGETCGLAWMSAAVALVRAPAMAISSHGRISRRVQRALAAVTVMPARTRALAGGGGHGAEFVAIGEGEEAVVPVFVVVRFAGFWAACGVSAGGGIGEAEAQSELSRSLAGAPDGADGESGDTDTGNAPEGRHGSGGGARGREGRRGCGEGWEGDVTEQTPKIKEGASGGGIARFRLALRGFGDAWTIGWWYGLASRHLRKRQCLPR